MRRHIGVALVAILIAGCDRNEASDYSRAADRMKVLTGAPVVYSNPGPLKCRNASLSTPGSCLESTVRAIGDSLRHRFVHRGTVDGVASAFQVRLTISDPLLQIDGKPPAAYAFTVTVTLRVLEELDGAADVMRISPEVVGQVSHQVSTERWTRVAPPEAHGKLNTLLQEVNDVLRSF